MTFRKYNSPGDDPYHWFRFEILFDDGNKIERTISAMNKTAAFREVVRQLSEYERECVTEFVRWDLGRCDEADEVRTPHGTVYFETGESMRVIERQPFLEWAKTNCR